MRSLFLLGPFLSLDLSLDATDKPHKICFNKEWDRSSPIVFTFIFFLNFT